MPALTYKAIEQDLDDLAALAKRRAQGNLTDVEILLHILRPLHVIAAALDRMADHYCGRRAATHAERER